MLKASNIHKTYRIGRQSLHVLRGVSLQVRDGETVAVVGVSGAGKSTLLHILGGLDAPDSGVVSMDERLVYRLSSARRAALRSAEIGFIFQAYHLLPELDVLENVVLPSMSRPGWRKGAAAARGRALELLAAVGLREWTEHTPLELSGGEQQRVALARALMNRPRLILADEPTGNLDSASGRQVVDILFAMTREENRALVIVTHDQQLAARCDRIYHLFDGAMLEKT